MTTQETQETEAEWVHPLNRVTLSSSLTNWGEWERSWDEEMERVAPRTENLLGSLHLIFAIPGGYSKAVLHLLEIADGYYVNFTLREGDPVIYFPKENRKIGWNVRHVIAEKAWKLLCDNFFKNRAEKSWHTPSWTRTVADKEVFNRLLWFFDPQKRCLNIPYRNNRDRYDETALQFLREFVIFAWYFRTFDDRWGPHEEDEVIQKMFREARPKLVEILDAIHGLDFLLNGEGLIKENEYPERLINAAVIAKLEELALENHETVKEAAWAGSYAAQTLLVLHSNMKEQKRQKHITEAEQQAEEARHKLAKLSGKK